LDSSSVFNEILTVSNADPHHHEQILRRKTAIDVDSASKARYNAFNQTSKPFEERGVGFPILSQRAAGAGSAVQMSFPNGLSEGPANRHPPY